MSPADASTLVKLDDSINVPAGVASAFNRSRSVCDSSSAFVDRLFESQRNCEQVLAWRWVGIITGEQCAAMLRKIRRDIEQNPGEISLADTYSSIEIDQREVEHERIMAEVDAELAAEAEQRRAG